MGKTTLNQNNYWKRVREREFQAFAHPFVLYNEGVAIRRNLMEMERK